MSVLSYSLINQNLNKMEPTKNRLLNIGTNMLLLSFIMIMTSFQILQNEQKPEPETTKEIVQGVYSINDTFVRLFAIHDTDGYIVVDAGANADSIATELKKVQIDPSNVKAVFLTHTHRDHIAALKLFKNAHIYLAANELENLNGEKPASLKLGNEIYPNTFSFLKDQEIIRFKTVNVRAIFTPGHSLGSTSFVVNGKYLFVGDALSLVNGKIDKPNPAYTKDMKMAFQSFDKIKNLPNVKYIFTAHTGYTDNYKNAVDTQLK